MHISLNFDVVRACQNEKFSWNAIWSNDWSLFDEIHEINNKLVFHMENNVLIASEELWTYIIDSIRSFGRRSNLKK